MTIESYEIIYKITVMKTIANKLVNIETDVENSGRRGLLKFGISINAGAAKVYRDMLDEKTYNEWTAVFNPTSHFIGSWQKGSRIQFLGTGQDGKTGGMSCEILENIPGKFLSIGYLAEIRDGKEFKADDSWTGGFENYTFKETNGKTLLSVEIEVINEFHEYFNETWPLALKKVKEICERQN
jgi:hypothetical protein